MAELTSHEPTRRCARWWALAFAGVTLGGCAYSYVDDQGARHVMGLVDLKLVAADSDDTFAGDVVDLSTFGISFSDNAAGRSFTIGYSREVTGHLRNHALVMGNPLAIRGVGQSDGTQ